MRNLQGKDKHKLPSNAQIADLYSIKKYNKR